MTDLKRQPVKMIRDFIKKDYKYDECCYICGSKEKLELHHLYGVSELFDIWCRENKIRYVKDTEHVTELRVKFAEDYADLLSNDNLYTLCNEHHKKLHNIYGQKYAKHLATKVANWIEIQRDKHGK